MGKRRLLRKLQRLEKRIKRLKSDEDTVLELLNKPQENKENEPPEEVEQIPPEEVEQIPPEEVEQIPPEEVEQIPPEENIQPDIEIELLKEIESEGENSTEELDTLDNNVLEILGVTSQQSTAGEILHKQIAERWEIIIKKGLTKEEKEKIEKENPTFSNFNQMIPPKLNAEVNAAVNETSRKRDQLVQKRQQQISTALSCLGSGLQMCIKDIQGHKLDIIKKLNDASRLLCDSLYLDTRGRRFLMLSAINKDMKEFLIQSEPETYLFGENLTEKIKTAKAVQRSGQELKVAETKKVTLKNNTTITRQPHKNKNLNWRGPPHPEVKKKGGPSQRTPTVIEKKREDSRTRQRRK